MRRWGLIFALLCALAAGALAEDAQAKPDARRYGGSGADMLFGMAVSGDGRIAMAGYTESDDGVFVHMPGMSGRSGWIVCEDMQGGASWVCREQLGEMDTIWAPVFREDGSGRGQRAGCIGR